MARAILFTLAVAVLVLLLVREVWRVVAPSIRRARDRRAHDVTIEARTEEALHIPGATPANAVEVRSASVVETQATAEPCVLCGARVHAEAHVVESFGELQLRVVRLACRRCGHRRPFYARIVQAPALH